MIVLPTPIIGNSSQIQLQVELLAFGSHICQFDLLGIADRIVFVDRICNVCAKFWPYVACFNESLTQIEIMVSFVLELIFALGLTWTLVNFNCLKKNHLKPCDNFCHNFCNSYEISKPIKKEPIADLLVKASDSLL